MIPLENFSHHRFNRLRSKLNINAIIAKNSLRSTVLSGHRSNNNQATGNEHIQLCERVPEAGWCRFRRRHLDKHESRLLPFVFHPPCPADRQLSGRRRRVGPRGRRQLQWVLCGRVLLQQLHSWLGCGGCSGKNSLPRIQDQPTGGHVPRQ